MITNVNSNPQNRKNILLRRFLKKYKFHFQNYIPPSVISHNKQSLTGYVIKIRECTGLKKSFPNNQPPPLDKNYFLCFSVCFYSEIRKSFFGNSHKSQLIEVSFDNNGNITPIFSNEDPVNIYYFSSDNEQYKVIIEISFVITTLTKVILSQEVLSWCIIDFRNQEQTNLRNIMYSGTCREILYREANSFQILSGSNLQYSYEKTNDTDPVKNLISEQTAFGFNTEIPGLLLRYIPKEITIINQVKLLKFENIYLKNIEIEFSENVMNQVLQYGKDYQRLTQSVSNNISINEIEMVCFTHNSWTNLSNNKEKSKVKLTQKGNFFLYQGVIEIENYFLDPLGLCAIICEINVYASIPHNGKIDKIKFPLSMGIIIRESFDYENIFDSTLMITGPCSNLSEENMIDLKNTKIKMNYVISKNKDEISETFQDKQIEQLNYQIANVKESLSVQGSNNAKEMISHLDNLEEEYKKKSENIKLMYNRDSQYSSMKESQRRYDNIVEPDHQFLIDKGKPLDERIEKSIEVPDNTELFNSNLRYEDNYQEKEIKSQPNLNNYNNDYNYFTDQMIKKKNLEQAQTYNINEFDEFKSFQNREYNLPRVDITKGPKSNIYYQPSLSKPLSIQDEVNLAARGIISMNENEDLNSPSILQLVYETEIKSRTNNFGDLFSFIFSAFKPLKNIESYNTIPNEIQFSFSFWEFETFITDSAKVKKPTNIDIIPSSTPLCIEKISNLSAKTDEKQLKIDIAFDPSANDTIDYKHYINYLLMKSLFVKVIDSEKQIEIGFMKIPLKILLKQGKPSLFINKEFEIYDLQTYEKKGSIQMIIKSDAIKTYNNYTKDIIENTTKFKYFSTLNNSGKVKKKKVVSIAPFNMNSLTTNEKELLAKEIYEENRLKDINRNQVRKSSSQYSNPYTFTVDKETEKKLRVLKYMSKNGENITIPDQLIEKKRLEHEQQCKFYETINYANKVKELNKPYILQKTINDSSQNTLTISLIQGNPHFFNYVIFNSSSKNELYHIVISSNAEKTQTSNETVSIITNPEDYQRITKLNRLKIPNDYNCISPDYDLICKPFESVPLIIKLLSYDSSLEKEKFTIWVFNEKNVPIYFLTIIISRVFPIIDHVFSYNVPYGKLNNIIFMNPFKYNKEKTHKILENMISEDKTVSYKIDSITNDFCFNFISPKNENQKYENLIFLYLDKNRDTLFATWKISISPRTSIEVSSSLGVRSKNSLTLFPIPSSKTVCFYSSNPEVLYFNEKFASPFILIPQMQYDIDYVVYPKKETNYELLVTCVDVSNKEILKSWMVKTRPNKCEISQIIKLNCKINSVTNVKFQFTNPLHEFSVIRFESSNKSILTVKKDMIGFNPEETMFIYCDILSQRDIARASVYVFITDAEDVFSETVLFQINYFN